MRGDRPLYGAASLSMDGLAGTVPQAPTFEKEKDLEPKIDVEPDAWATKNMCVGPTFGQVRYDKLPIQSMNPLQYSHEKLYSEKTVIGLLSEAYERGKADGWDACETCHGIVGGVTPNAELRGASQLAGAASLSNDVLGAAAPERN